MEINRKFVVTIALNKTEAQALYEALNGYLESNEYENTEEEKNILENMALGLGSQLED